MRSEELADALELLADGPPWDTAWLRSLLPELAVRGRLVAQEEGDRPFPDWATQVSSAAERLRDAGFRAAKQRPEPDAPEATPLGWRWSVMGNVGAIVGGGTPKSGEPGFWADTGDGIPWLTPADLDDPGPVLASRGRRDITKEGLENSSAQLLPAGSVLFSSRAPIGKVAIAENALATNQGFKSCVPFVPEAGPYFYLWLLVARAEIEASATGTTFKEISGKGFGQVPIPLPPLAEQHRIVAKVDELMEHAAVVEERHLAATSARVRLRDAALHALAEAEDHEAVETAWSRIEEHFDDLFTEPEDIQPLRQTILQLAVRGRLVAQEEGDEDARETVGEVCSLLNGYAFKSSWYVKSSEGVRVVRNANVSHGFLEWSEERRVSLEKATEFERFDLVEGDIVLSLDRPVISSGIKLARVAAADLPCLLLQRVLAIRPSSSWIARDYLYCWLQSPEFRDRLDPGRSNGVPHVSSKEVSEMSLRIPPLAEQHRIVAKVDELMALCDTLETSLTRAKATREQFAGSISHTLAESH